MTPLRISYRRLWQHWRPFILLWACTAGAGCLFAIIGFVLWAIDERARRQGAALLSPVFFTAFSALILGYGGWLAGRAGYFADSREIGLLSVRGRPLRFRTPVVRFVRLTFTNWRWVGRIGMRSMQRMPLIVAVNDHEQRVFAISPRLYEDADLERFLATADLPISGSWSDEVGRATLRKRWPAAPDVRLQLRVLLAPYVAVLVLAATAVVIIDIALTR